MELNDVVLLIQSDSSQPPTSFFDGSASGHTVTPIGDVMHVSDPDAFRGTFIYFDGSGDFLSIPDSPDFFYGDGPYTIAFQIKRDRVNTREMVYGQGNGSPGGVAIRMEIDSLNRVGIYRNNVGIDTGIIISDTNLHHIAFIDDGTNFIAYLDGAAGTIGGHIAIIDSDRSLLIGDQVSGGTLNFKGKIGEFIIARCVIWDGEFSPPTAPYGFLVSVDFYCEQIISSIITKSQIQTIGMAPRLYHQVTQIMATARLLNLTHDQVFDTTTPIHLQQDQVFNNLAQVALLTTQVMHNYGAPVALEMLQTWAAYDYNLVYLPVVQLIGSQLDSVLQEIQFSVTVAASRVGVVDVDFDRKGFCNVATLLLRSRIEWSNKLVGDPVVLTVLGEQYQMIVVNKPQDEQITQGTYEVGYLLECASITCQLADGLNPDLAASRVTASFPSGAMLTSILDFLTDGVCSYNLAVPDFSTGGYDFDGAERFAALREVLPEQYGWIVETDQAGVLQLSQWRKPEIGGAGQKTITMSRKSLTPPDDTLYTQVEIRNYNQQDGTSGLILEVVDNGDGTGTIYVYSVPWTDAFDIFDSEDSSAPSLLITGGEVEEVEIDDTDVEFVDYAASLSKPCYSTPVIDWGNNDSLSPVTYTESGSLTTATEPGYSVAVTVTYTTKRKRWDFDNRKIDVSQVRIKYV